MENINKLKPEGPRKFWTTILVCLVFLTIMITVWISLGERTVDKMIAVLMFSRSVIESFAFIRTRNIAYLPGIIWPAIMALRLFSGVEDVGIRIVYTIIVITLFILDFFLMVKKKLKWRYHEVLELAAKPVEEVTNGFTPRPLPIGKISGSNSEIKDFAEFCRKNLMALPFSEENQIVLFIE